MRWTAIGLSHTSARSYCSDGSRLQRPLELLNVSSPVLDMGQWQYVTTIVEDCLRENGAVPTVVVSDRYRPNTAFNPSHNPSPQQSLRQWSAPIWWHLNR